MMDFGALFQQAGQQYGVDPQLLQAVAQDESSMDPNAVGGMPAIGDPNDRAMGLMQIRASNAKAAGIDPMNPSMAVPWSANYLAQRIKQFGSIENGLAAYHGGDDPANWGPKTRAYVQKVMGTYQGYKNMNANNLPGLPPTSMKSAGDVDPFAGLGDPAPAASAAMPPTSGASAAGGVDPFAGLDDGKGSPAPAAMKAASTTAAPAPDDGTFLGNAATAFGHHLMKPLHGGAQLIEHGVNSAVQAIAPGTQFAQAVQDTVNKDDAAVKQWEDSYQASQPGGAGTAVGATAGEVAPWLYGGLARGAMKAGDLAATPFQWLAGRLSPGATRYLAQTAGKLATGAGAGAVVNAAQPVTGGPPPTLSSLVTGGQPAPSFAQQKLDQLTSGAEGGAIGVPVGAAASRMLSPVVRPAVQALMREGVTPTPGQIGGGFMNWMEQAVASNPIVGGIVNRARMRSIEDMNVAAGNRALAPIGEKVESAPGREMIDEVQSKLSDAYNALLPKMQFNADPQFANDIANLRQMASNLPAQQRQQFENVLQNKLFARIAPGQPAGTVDTELARLQQVGQAPNQIMPANTATYRLGMDGQSLKGVQEELGDMARGYAGDPSFDNRQLGAAIGEVRNAVDAALARGNPQYAQQLTDINRGWANFARLRDAAAMVGAHDGVFSASQLQNAVKRGDKSAGKGAFARGDALMQDLSDPAVNVLGSTLPNSGTADRLGFMALAMHPGLLLHPSTYAALGPTLAYTKSGQALAAKMLTQRPDWARNAAPVVRQLAPVVGGLLGDDGSDPSAGGVLGR